MIFDQDDFSEIEREQLHKERGQALEILDFLEQYCKIESTVTETIQSFMKQYYLNQDLVLELLDLAAPEFCNTIMNEYQKLDKKNAERIRRIALKISEIEYHEEVSDDVFPEEQMLDDNVDLQSDQSGYSRNIEEILGLLEETSEIPEVTADLKPTAELEINIEREMKTEWEIEAEMKREMKTSRIVELEALFADAEIKKKKNPIDQFDFLYKKR